MHWAETMPASLYQFHPFKANYVHHSSLFHSQEDTMLLLFVEKIVLDSDQSNKNHELTLKPQAEDWGDKCGPSYEASLAMLIMLISWWLISDDRSLLLDDVWRWAVFVWAGPRLWPVIITLLPRVPRASRVQCTNVEMQLTSLLDTLEYLSRKKYNVSYR